MRTIILSLLVACTHAAPVVAPAPAPVMPNRVCAIVETESPSWRCLDAGHDAGPAHGDIAFVALDGGTKLCWETFDLKGPLACATLALSNAEKTEQAVQQAKAKQAEEDKAKVAVPTIIPSSATTTDATTKATPKAKKP